MSCCPAEEAEPNGIVRVKAAARTLTTLVIAVAATVLMTLAGCASSAGIAPTGSLFEPTDAGVSAAPAAPLPPTGGKASAIRH